MSLLLAVETTTGQETARIEGVVRNTSGDVLPGARVTVDGTLGAIVVADGYGQFALPSLAPGTYTVRAQLPGFRAQRQQVRVGDSITTRIAFVLSLGMPAEVLHVAGEPEDAYRQADLIAHVRVIRQLPPLQCSELSVISALHEGVVLSVVKGSAPTTIHFLQDSPGTCIEDAMTLEGIGEREYNMGAEYILFLTRSGNRYDRIAGGAFAFAASEKGV